MDFKIINKLTGKTIIEITVNVKQQDYTTSFIQRTLSIDKAVLSKEQERCITDWLNSYSYCCGVPLNPSELAQAELCLLTDIRHRLKFLAPFLNNGWYLGDDSYITKS